LGGLTPVRDQASLQLIRLARGRRRNAPVAPVTDE
jgi:hypothetical protein